MPSMVFFISLFKMNYCHFKWIYIKHDDLTPVTAVTHTHKIVKLYKDTVTAFHFQTTVCRMHTVKLLPVLTEIQPNISKRKITLNLWSKPCDKLYIKTSDLKTCL